MRRTAASFRPSGYQAKASAAEKSGCSSRGGAKALKRGGDPLQQLFVVGARTIELAVGRRRFSAAFYVVLVAGV